MKHQLCSMQAKGRAKEGVGDDGASGDPDVACVLVARYQESSPSLSTSSQPALLHMLRMYAAACHDMVSFVGGSQHRALFRI